MQSRATVPTENASKYLQQLCKHWSHRFTVDFDPQRGHIDFGDGRVVELAAGADALTLAISDSDTARDIGQLETVVADHIARFAFRETLEFNWQRDAA